MNTQKLGYFVLPVLLATSNAFAGPSTEDWQLTRLFRTTPHQLAGERQGKIFIYDGLTDRHIERDLSESFDRVESMMFVNVVKTDESGEKIVDSDSGEFVTEDDGC